MSMRVWSGNDLMRTTMSSGKPIMRLLSINSGASVAVVHRNLWSKVSAVEEGPRRGGALAVAGALASALLCLPWSPD